MPRVTPFLWFDDQAEQAAQRYAEVFPDATIHATQRGGGVTIVAIEIQGQQLTLFDGGPAQQLTEAFSLVVHCADQAEVDYYWDALSEGGQTNVCGWTKDRFGVSWQVVPTRFFELLQDPDPAVSGRVMAAMMQMTKFDIAALEAAAVAE
jgi:predicted 3-demethylubiquinone-9 3-methyltransferase (glyoxalase superfamily)